MQLIRAVLEIRYKKPASQFSFMLGIVEALGGNIPNPQALTFDGGMRIQLKDKKIVVIVESQRTAIGVEEPMEINQLKNMVDELSHKVNSRLNWNEMVRLGVRTEWIKPVEDFSGLVLKSKEIFFKDTPLSQEALDVALPLTLKDGDNKINFNYGPITKEQILQQYLEFKDNPNIPSAAGLVDIDYYCLLSKNYSRNFVKDYFEKAITYSSQKTESTFDLLGI